MKKMVIYDPAMCCPTGVCGPSVDKNLLRVSTLLNRLEKRGVKVDRHNLSDNPQAFIDNSEVNKLLMDDGVDTLPVTVVEGEIVKTKENTIDRESNGNFAVIKWTPEELKGEKLAALL